MKRSIFKRNIIIFLVLISFMQIAVCKSKKNASETTAESSVENTVDKKAAKAEAKAKKAAEKTAKKEAEEKAKLEEQERKIKEKEVKAAEKEKAKQTVSNNNPSYIGWVDTSSKDVIFRKGIMQIKVKPSMGTFNLGLINSKNRVVPVLATGNEFTTSSFNYVTKSLTIVSISLVMANSVVLKSLNKY